ncbi:MAG TPA: hypothetical protein ENI68_03190 [Gammaproteobacteria bacterium]|nr:hypothetical protein [Gammaproteobacteria bacterium]
MRISLLLTITITLIGALAQAKEYEHPQSTEISVALSAMQRQASDKFVIVELNGTENYFQYASDGQDFFYFDVPKMSLSDEQLERATRFFSSQNVKKNVVIDSGGTYGAPRRIVSFQKTFKNQDVAAGVSLGLGFMIEVIGHEAGITIFRGWE